jgi:hypothetical protein
MLPLKHKDGTPLTSQEIFDLVCSTANCGCVIHAEEGVACPHDVELWNKNNPQDKKE